MGGGNGNKAALKRERNQQKANDQKKSNSQLKSNEQARMTCKWCFRPISVTANKTDAMDHAESDGKDFAVCFPNWDEMQAKLAVARKLRPAKKK